MRVLLLLCAVACDPVWNVTVTVTDDKGAPLAGADVEIECPASGSIPLARERQASDMAGRVTFGGVGSMGTSGAGYYATACSLTIAKPGFTGTTSTITCLTGVKGSGCARGEAKVALKP